MVMTKRIENPDLKVLIQGVLLSTYSTKHLLRLKHTSRRLAMSPIITEIFVLILSYDKGGNEDKGLLSCGIFVY